MDFSTPVRKGRSGDFAHQFAGVTPIKSSQRNAAEDRDFVDEFEDILENDSSFFDNGKRKCVLASDKERLRNGSEASPASEHTKKRMKREGNETSAKCGEEDRVHAHADGDLFEEELFDDTFPSFVYRNVDKCHDDDEEDIIENSVARSRLLKIIGKTHDDEAVKDDGTESTDHNVNEESCHLNVYLEENPIVTTILDKMDLKEDDEEEEEEGNVGKVNNNTLSGFSQILMESVSKWDKESGICSGESNRSSEDVSLADKIKEKLMGNAQNVQVKKSDASGWTQIDDRSNIGQESLMLNSQYQEVGPFFGLPSKVRTLYEEHKGIKDLYDWQKECLTLKAIKERRNFVYSLPTSGGKTLVAEILILRELLCYKRNVLFILPFVSIVQEKVHDLSVFGVELGFLVEEYAAGKGVIPVRKRRKRKSVIIATIEKASAVVISLIESSQLGDFGLIVVDELHLVSEESKRGTTLETLLTLVLHVGDNVQIVGMTATIGNLREIARFLKAESYEGSFRPVELRERVKCGSDVYAVNWDADEILTRMYTVKSAGGSDPDGICDLVLETIPNDSVLVFCPTKKNCENVAVLIAEMMPKSLRSHKEAEKLSLFRALKSETNGQVCPVMKKTIPFGVAYHHSGLTPGERKLLEEGFRSGTLCVICCTSTLAAGVNLPAARVILRSPYVGKDFISKSKYKQMIGRAGRTGMGCKGESYLICQPCDSGKVGELLRSRMDDSVSKMDSDSVKHLILSSIGLGVATCRSQLRKLLACTLLHVQAERLNVNVKKLVDSCIASLFKMGAIRVKESEVEEEHEHEHDTKLDITVKRAEKRMLRITNSSQLSVSRLGRAAVKGCIGLERAHELYGDLVKAQSALVLLTELHLLYLVTPYDVVEQIKPNFSVFFNVYMQLSPKELPSAKTIGVTEFVVSKLATGTKPKNVSESLLSRFYAALVLNELLKQQNVWEVARLFEIPAGTIQTLMTSASTFANNVLRFCDELSELWCFKSLLSDFAPRLTHCCSAELVPLMELPAVKRGRAKQLYDAGFKTLAIVATARASDLVKSVDHLSRRVATEIIAAARLLLLEKAENLKEEAEEVLEGLADKVVTE